MRVGHLLPFPILILFHRMRFYSTTLAHRRDTNKLAIAGVEVPHFKAKDDCQPFWSRPDYAQYNNDESQAKSTFADFTSHNPELHIVLRKWAISIYCLRETFRDH